MDRIVGLIWTLCFWLFLAVKVAGTSFVAWSWWWVFFPPVPVFSLLVQYWGL